MMFKRDTPVMITETNTKMDGLMGSVVGFSVLANVEFDVDIGFYIIHIPELSKILESYEFDYIVLPERCVASIVKESKYKI